MFSIVSVYMQVESQCEFGCDAIGQLQVMWHPPPSLRPSSPYRDAATPAENRVVGLQLKNLLLIVKVAQDALGHL